MESTFAALKPGFPDVLGGDQNGWAFRMLRDRDSSVHMGRIPAWQLCFSFFITLLSFLWYLSLLKILAYQLLYFFFFLLSHCPAHQSFVTFAFWSPDLVVTSLSVFLLHPVYQHSIPTLVQCCSHGTPQESGWVRHVLEAGFILCSGPVIPVMFTFWNC